MSADRNYRVHLHNLAYVVAVVIWRLSKLLVVNKSNAFAEVFVRFVYFETVIGALNSEFILELITVAGFCFVLCLARRRQKLECGFLFLCAGHVPIRLTNL